MSVLPPPGKKKTQKKTNTAETHSTGYKTDFGLLAENW